MQIPVKINGLYKIRISADTIQRFTSPFWPGAAARDVNHKHKPVH